MGLLQKFDSEETHCQASKLGLRKFHFVWIFDCEFHGVLKTPRFDGIPGDSVRMAEGDYLSRGCYPLSFRVACWRALRLAAALLRLRAWELCCVSRSCALCWLRSSSSRSRHGSATSTAQPRPEAAPGPAAAAARSELLAEHAEPGGSSDESKMEADDGSTSAAGQRGSGGMAALERRGRCSRRKLRASYRLRLILRSSVGPRSLSHSLIPLHSRNPFRTRASSAQLPPLTAPLRVTHRGERRMSKAISIVFPAGEINKSGKSGCAWCLSALVLLFAYSESCNSARQIGTSIFNAAQRIVGQRELNPQFTDS